MGRLWCVDCREARLPMGTPKPVTVVVPYYENRAFFGAQLRKWMSYPSEVLAQTSFIVVDDGSPRHPALEVVKALRPSIRLRLFRIEVDVRWNWLAARNIGFHYAPEGWVLVTDMDHVVPTETLVAAMTEVHDPQVVYAFHRREHNGQACNPHSASFLMTRAKFWEIGGYDETLSGHYGTDGVFRREIVKHARIDLLPHLLIRHEYVDDSSTTDYARKQPEDAAVGRLVAARRPNWRPKVLSFPYHEEALAA